MNSKKFVKLFIRVFISILLLIVLLNIIVSPFGLFKDQFLNWHSYNMTQNPRIAKIEYLDKNHEKFDSYVVGASGSSAFLSKYLDKYTGDKFYNLFYYGADMLDSVDTVKYIVKNYEVKNIFLPLTITHGLYYNVGNERLNDKMHYKVENSSPVEFYSKYLLANPNYSIDKIKSIKKDSYLQESFDVFNAENGSYDKSLRDVEPIHSKDEYLSKEEYNVFNYDFSEDKHLDYIEDVKKSLIEIKEICEKENINLEVVMCPLYNRDYKFYNKNEVEKFYKEISQVVSFWDFTNSSISYEPRYFYDRTHWRNSVGTMMLAKVYDDKNIYMPEDFGYYVTKDNYKEASKRFFADTEINNNVYSEKVPILMYHDIRKSGDNADIISYENFERQIRFLKEEGYNTVDFNDLYNYVNKGVELPNKPILITFDDGYKSNYNLAYPLLKELNYKATIYPIGFSIGKDKYKDTNEKIIPHFSIDEAREMYESGLIDFGSHSFDMHQAEKFEKNKARTNAMKFEDESEKEFIEILEKDIASENKLINKIKDKDVDSFAYPGGYYSDLTAVILSENNIKSTVTTIEGQNYIIKGLPQSLYGLKRFFITDQTTNEDLLNYLNSK
ncbi:polysaccharide deacetylase family protein [Peptoniphilus stercorisuis]|uniref:Peptidoglycan/xylan/chitin deacetylase (PgdA/CDA1 family) n=1 Tax=Peptoniphilus stercorisuis TaxID=1436965 RepID=A0ABS4KDU7_9FIRM|nr:polysaccharide deacetylase family protein [Peptoniphilus stercorisuis]MBP2025575.1 peptidoglycan/xylan/chitin deacetylase (PgdA/CDA1 family) [Peptoniphilus stercorisuis]